MKMEMNVLRKPESELSFKDLRVRYGTGRSYVISGTGRDRKMGYRVGKMTDIGDIERSEWIRLMASLIERTGEQKIQDQLKSWVKEKYPWRRTKAEIEEEALELHAARIFESPEWVCFLAFNERFSPARLQGVELRLVETACCKRVGRVTAAMLERAKRLHPDMVACPICGRTSAFDLISEAVHKSA